MTEKEQDYERKRISVITVTGGMIFSVLAMVAGSWLGTAGTLYGAAFGSGFSAIGGTIYENMARKAHAKLKARKEQEEAETRMIPGGIMDRTLAVPGGREALIRSRTKRIMYRERNPWKTATLALGSLVLFALVTLGTLFGVEKATGKTLHANVTNSRQYGTSFSYSTVPPPSPSPLPSSPVSSPSSTSPSASPDAIPDASPDQAPTGGASSPAPTSTPSSLSTPESTPSVGIAPGDRLVPSSSAASTP